MSVPSNLIPRRMSELPDYNGTDASGYIPYLFNGNSYRAQFANIAGLQPILWRKRFSLEGAEVSGTPAQNAVRIQAKIDALYAAGGGTLYFNETFIPIDRPLMVMPKVSLIGPGPSLCRIANTNATYEFHSSACFQFGNFHPDVTQQMWGNSNSKALNAVAAGVCSATLTSAGDAAGFEIGDYVIFASTAAMTGAGGQLIAAYMAIRKIVGKSGATLQVDEPFRDGFSGFAHNLRTTAIIGEGVIAPVPPSTTPTGGRVLFAWAEAVAGGFTADTVGYWMADSATYKAQWFDIETASRAIAYGNTLQHSRFTNVGGRFAVTCVETSLNSENTVVENMTAAYDQNLVGNINAVLAAQGKPAISYATACSLQENGLDVTVQNSDLDITGTSGGPVLRTINFDGGRFLGLRVRHRGNAYTGDVIAIGDPSPATNRRLNTGTRVQIDWEGPCGTYVHLYGGAADASIDGQYRGTPVTAAVYITDVTSRNTIEPTASFDEGQLLFSSAASGQQVVGCYIGGGAAAMTSESQMGYLLNNNVRELSTVNSVSRRPGTTAIVSDFVLTGVTTEQDILAKAVGVLQRGDRIDFAFRVSVTGTNGTKTFNVRLVNTTDSLTYQPVSFQIPAANPGIYEFSGSIHVTALNRTIVDSALVGAPSEAFRAAINPAKSGVTADLTGKAITLKLTEINASPSDSSTTTVARLALNNAIQW